MYIKEDNMYKLFVTFNDGTTREYQDKYVVNTYKEWRNNGDCIGICNTCSFSNNDGSCVIKRSCQVKDMILIKCDTPTKGFTTQAEIYQALLDGKTLRHKSGDITVKLVNDNQVTSEKVPMFKFVKPRAFEIVPEKVEVKVYALINKHDGKVKSIYDNFDTADKAIKNHKNLMIVELTKMVELE